MSQITISMLDNPSETIKKWLEEIATETGDHFIFTVSKTGTKISIPKKVQTGTRGPEPITHRTLEDAASTALQYLRGREDRVISFMLEQGWEPKQEDLKDNSRSGSTGGWFMD